MWKASESAVGGLIFDDTGEALLPHPVLLAHRLGFPGENLDAVVQCIRECGFVQVVPVHDALLVKFEPASVHPLAAFAAFYEIAARAPSRLILSFPSDGENPDRYEIFGNPIDGLRRIELALEGSRIPPGPAVTRSERLSVDRRFRRPRRRRFSRHAAIAAVSNPRGIPIRTKARAGDRSERLPRPLDSIQSADEWLGELLVAWRNAHCGWRLPSIESLDSFELLNIARGRAHIVDTRDADPEGYRFRLWGTVNSYGSGHANKTLGEMPAGLMRDDAIEDYRGVVTTGVPGYQLIHHVENNLSYSYARLVLPLAADGRCVDRLIVLINERHLSELDTP